MRKALSFLVIVFVASASPASPSADGQRSTFAPDRLARIDQVLQQYVIASQTKAITSAAILVLLPTFAKTTVAVRNEPGSGPLIGSGVGFVTTKRPITIRDLLRHTAGISYGTQNDIAALYDAKGLGPAAGSVGTPQTRTNRSATRWSGSERCRSLRSPATPLCTATTPTSSGA